MMAMIAFVTHLNIIKSECGSSWRLLKCNVGALFVDNNYDNDMTVDNKLH